MRTGRVLLVLLVIVALLVVAGYVGASVVIYDMLSRTAANCAGSPGALENTPAQFAVSGIDTERYAMPDYQTVSFPSRDDAHITIQAWYVAADGQAADAPAVILVHGLTSCRHANSILLAAGMLHRAGFHTLMIDMRDHGESTVEDGRYAGGSEEYRDVLGAYDWLLAQGHDANRIGVYGQSLGATTVMIAAGEEPRIAAVFEDSGFADIRDAVNAELTRNGFPTLLSDGALFMGRVLSGDEIGSRSPLQGVQKLDGRPLFITHGTEDTRLSVDYAGDLEAAVLAQGGNVETWILPGVEHVAAIFEATDEYERRLVGFFEQHLR